MRARFVGRAVGLAAVVLFFQTLPALANEAEPARFMPTTASVYFEVTQAERLLDRGLDPELHQMLAEAPQVAEFYQTPNFRHVKTVVGLLETRLGMKWPQIARGLAGSAHLCHDGEANSTLFVLRARNAQTLSKLHDALKDLVELDATSKGKPSPVESQEYLGVTTFTFGPHAFHAVVDDLLLVSNQRYDLQAALERRHDAALPNLADTAEFRQARQMVLPEQAGWAMVRLDAVRKNPKVETALQKKTNPASELIAGGLVAALRTSTLAVGSLHLDGRRWRLSTQIPTKQGETTAARAWFFGQEPAGQAPFPPRIPGTILSISSYRDVAGMWQSRDELFDEATAARLAQADTNLGLYFAGQDFGTQILSQFGPYWQIVVARQEFKSGQPTPAIKLPAVAIVMELKNPESFGTTLLVAYQKAIGLINLIGGQQGQQQLLLGSEEHEGVRISTATYLVDRAADLQAAPLYYNASPSCARVGNRFILGSTTEIVRQLVPSVKSTHAGESVSDNTRVEFDIAQLAAALDENRATLVSQNMLSEGNSRGEAEGEVDLMMGLLRRLDQASLRIARQSDRIVIEATVGSDK